MVGNVKRFSQGSPISQISSHQHPLLNLNSSLHVAFSFIHFMSSFTAFTVKKCNIVWFGIPSVYADWWGEEGRAPCAAPSTRTECVGNDITILWSRAQPRTCKTNPGSVADGARYRDLLNRHNTAG